MPYDFEIAPDSPFALTLIEVRYGLPEYAGAQPFTPRPEYMVPEPNTTPTVDFSVEGIKKVETDETDLLEYGDIFDGSKEIDAKVDFARMEQVLMEEGLKKFADPQKALIQTIAGKRKQMVDGR